ncbi:MAG: cobalamin-binding protein [Bacteroidota bacterium]
MSTKIDFFPKRIVCLTEEPTETLYLLGEEERIVGITGFTVRPKRARKEKPKVSAFTSAKIDQILALQPDLVIGFSDIQAEIARELIAKGVTVWINNYRSVEEIYKMIVQLGSLVGKQHEAVSLVNQFQEVLKKSCAPYQSKAVKPRIYFEEWYDPLISGIRWVSELIELAGGVDIFSEFQHTSLAKDRIIADQAEVVRRNPDIIIASWCGKKFKKDRLVSREKWDHIAAVKNDYIFEIKSDIILQPGPAAVTEGVQEIISIIGKWHAAKEVNVNQNPTT